MIANTKPRALTSDPRHALLVVGVALLLLLAWLAVPGLDREGLWYDEIFTMRVAGGAGYGPLSPSGILERVVFEDPTQGLGYPLLVGAWGALFGWSEFALRLIAFFGGLLACALTGRLGTQIGGWRVGLASLLVMSVSAYFIWYLHEGRVYTLVVALGAALLWSYSTLMQCRAHPGWPFGVLFTFSAAGLWYANYYAVVLLAALAVLHLLYFRGSRRWWFVVYCAALAGVVILPSLVGFARGFARAQDVTNLGTAFVLRLPELLRIVVHYAANGSTPLLLVVWLAAVGLGWRNARLRWLVGVVALCVVLTLLWQAVLQFIDYTKIRYVLVFWSALAVLGGVGLVKINAWLAARIQQPRWKAALLSLVPLLWLVGGLNASRDIFFLTATGEAGFLMRWRTLTNVLEAEGFPGGDIFAYYAGARQHDDAMSFAYSMWPVTFTTFITGSVFDGSYDWAVGKLAEARRVWYGMDQRVPPTATHTRFLALLTANDYTPCAYVPVDTPIARLELFVRSPAYCPGGEPIVRFGTGITLTGWDLPAAHRAERLLLPMGWQIAPDVPPETYSLAVFAMQDDGILAQADVGLPARRFSLLDATLDLSGVAPGPIDIRLAVYNWRTNERLPGVLFASGLKGDLLPIATLDIVR